MGYPRFDALLSNVQLFGDYGSSNAAIVKFAVEKVIYDVAIYCNIEVSEIPEKLDHTLVSIATTFIDTHALVQSDTDKGVPANVQTITEGTTTVTFKSTAQAYAEIQSANPITDDYRSQLNHFRKLAK